VLLCEGELYNCVDDESFLNLNVEGIEPLIYPSPSRRCPPSDISTFPLRSPLPAPFVIRRQATGKVIVPLTG
jgi:hypothetical protein